MVQCVHVLKTIIISVLSFRALINTNCEDGKNELRDNLHSYIEESHASLTLPSTNQGTGKDDVVPIYVAEQVQQEEALNCDMKLLAVTYDGGFIARHDTWYQL